MLAVSVAFAIGMAAGAFLVVYALYRTLTADRQFAVLAPSSLPETTMHTSTADRFAICLADMLREEEGTDQPIGGPYHRGRWAYSDDPDDSGGKTMMGILQREYDAWRRRQGLPAQWVKHISDEELTIIYRDQYWLPVQADALPAGVDLAVFDMGVNCGVGNAIRKLQMALGIEVDGHLGQVTLDAANAADAAELIARFSDLRRAYHRACRTFWKHGRNWLERTARIEGKARHYAEIDARQPAPVPDGVACTEFTTCMAKAEIAAPEHMGQSNTGNTAVLVGGAGTSTIGVVAGKAAAKVVATCKAALFTAAWFGHVLLELVQTYEFWGGVITLAGATYVWLERRRKLKEYGI
ncbi:glycosyl hydrolase 108 family protein [Hyphomicrobium sp.]|uniref:glycoside hydrolase family 108 protein n=1 Tax=Hyphomicrobium sp. TaxID=82 RepID=UPI00132AED5C|nr:glycosyl hydrolase 108 family protein [Hyphomicrobium sp.]KAB2937407.1 MAG: glycoside hydrolase family 108 protein [Hyphomicrobium sp.]